CSYLVHRGQVSPHLFVSCNAKKRLRPETYMFQAVTLPDCHHAAFLICVATLVSSSKTTGSCRTKTYLQMSLLRCKCWANAAVLSIKPFQRCSKPSGFKTRPDVFRTNFPVANNNVWLLPAQSSTVLPFC